MVSHCVGRLNLFCSWPTLSLTYFPYRRDTSTDTHLKEESFVLASGLSSFQSIVCWSQGRKGVEGSLWRKLVIPWHPGSRARRESPQGGKNSDLTHPYPVSYRHIERTYHRLNPWTRVAPAWSRHLSFRRGLWDTFLFIWAVTLGLFPVSCYDEECIKGYHWTDHCVTNVCIFAGYASGSWTVGSSNVYLCDFSRSCYIVLQNPSNNLQPQVRVRFFSVFPNTLVFLSWNSYQSLHNISWY